jgi:hypothetical protein
LSPRARRTTRGGARARPYCRSPRPATLVAAARQDQLVVAVTGRFRAAQPVARGEGERGHLDARRTAPQRAGDKGRPGSCEMLVARWITFPVELSRPTRSRPLTGPPLSAARAHLCGLRISLRAVQAQRPFEDHRFRGTRGCRPFNRVIVPVAPQQGRVRTPRRACGRGQE